MKIEIRSFLASFFSNPKISTSLEMVRNIIPYYYKNITNAYDVDTVRACIHSIASNTAKLNIKHIKGQSANKTSNFDRLLGLRPNPFMSSYDFIYKMVSLLYTTNNAFCYISYDDSYNIQGFYPVDYSNIQLLQDGENNLYYKFSFINGLTHIARASDLIHIRRHFNRHDLFGDEALNPILNTLNLINNAYEATEYALKNSGQIDGIIKTTSTIGDDELKKYHKNFVDTYKNKSNNGGVGMLDSRAEYIPLNAKPFEKVSFQELKFAREQIYRYFNISENIINSSYSEQEYNAFYNSVVEPLAIQLSQEFTHKIFTKTELGFGNEIKFSSDRMLFASQQTKLQIIRESMPLGLLSINESREIFEMSPIDEEYAKKRFISLNYVDVKHQNKYQGVGTELNDEGKQP